MSSVILLAPQQTATKGKISLKKPEYADGFFFSIWEITSLYFALGGKKGAEFCTHHAFLIGDYRCAALHPERLFSDFQQNLILHFFIVLKK